jgi:hypothetical protein
MRAGTDRSCCFELDHDENDPEQPLRDLRHRAFYGMAPTEHLVP